MVIYNEKLFNSEADSLERCKLRVISNGSQFRLSSDENIIICINNDNETITEYIVSVSAILKNIKDISLFSLERPKAIVKCLDKIHVQKSVIK